MPDICPECGAPCGDGESCITNLHALLYLESIANIDTATRAADRGEVAHFYAVGCYILQHPEGMNYRTDTIIEVRHSIADHLSGRLSVEALRKRVRLVADGPSRIRRRTGDEAPGWSVDEWPMTVADVLAGGTEAYHERVTEWAESVIARLDSSDPG